MRRTPQLPTPKQEARYLLDIQSFPEGVRISSYFEISGNFVSGGKKHRVEKRIWRILSMSREVESSRGSNDGFHKPLRLAFFPGRRVPL